MAKVTSIRSKVLNSSLIGSGQLGAGDRGAGQAFPYYSSNPETYTNPIERWRQLYLMYSTSWECRKVVNIPVDDALRKPPILKGINADAAAILKKKFDRIQLIPTLKRSLKLERLFGGCLTFMGLDSDSDDPATKYNPRSAETLRFINSIPISRISRMTWDTNPLSENYMRPEVFFVNNQQVHVSRCLLWDGQPLIDPNDFALTNYRANLAGFGSSVMSALWDDVIMAVGTRQAAYQMAQVNGAIIAAIQDLQDLTGTAPGVRNLNKIKDVINQLSTFRAAVIDGEKVDVKSFSSSFGSVPELLMAYLQVLSAASDIPATRFLGQAPGGLNATGDSDLENYYNMLDAFQHERITPQLMRLCDVIGYAEIPGWAAERDKLEIEWPPLWNETAKEQAERASMTIDYVLKLVDASLMGDEQALEELNARGILSVKLEADELALLGSGEEEEKPAGGDLGQQLERLKNMAFPATLTDNQRYKVKQEGRLVAMGGKNKYQNPYPLKSAAYEAWLEGWKEEEDVYKRQRVTNGVDLDELIIAAGGDRDTVGLMDFEKGWKVEQEHRGSVAQDAEPNDNLQLARIVLDHLGEDPHYYEKLGRVENIDPSPAQIAAGNYKKTHVRLHGLDIAIENPKGSVRRGIDPQTKKVWECTLPADYGYIKRTEGADGDHVDVYIGPAPDSQAVFVVDQVDLQTGAWDEHKCILGCASPEEARDLYLSGFSDGLGHRRLGALHEMTIDTFKRWLVEGDTSRPYGGQQ